MKKESISVALTFSFVGNMGLTATGIADANNGH